MVKGLEAKVSEQEATEMYLNNTALKLQYRRFLGIQTTEGYQVPFIKLVYQQEFKNGLNSGYAIDAATGRWKSGSQL